MISEKGHGLRADAARRGTGAGWRLGPAGAGDRQHLDQGTPTWVCRLPGVRGTVMGVIRVLLADDYPVVRAGLKVLISAQPDMTVVGEAGDGDAALREALA